MMDDPGAFWDARYAGAGYLFGEGPSVFLTAHLPSLPPGRLLLPGDGEGRNGVYAARLGWAVTSVDLSGTGRAKALRLAEAAGVGLTYHVADALTYAAEAPFDAVGFFFLHLPAPQREVLLQRVATWLRPGGWLILEGYTPAQVGLGTGGPGDPSWMYTLAELAAACAGWTVHHQWAGRKLLAEGPAHQGPSETVEWVAQKPTETPPAPSPTP